MGQKAPALWPATRTVPKLIAAGFSHVRRPQHSLDHRRGLEDPAARRMLPLPVRFLVAMIAHAINAHMARRVEYLMEEVRVLREVYTETTGRQRIPFTPEQRRRLAIKGKALTPEEREECCQLVRPATILAWFTAPPAPPRSARVVGLPATRPLRGLRALRRRQLTNHRYDSSSQRRKPGRPRKADEIRALVLRLARENFGWGYTKIRDALRGMKIEIGRTTVASILAEAGLEPAPERLKQRTWKQFVRAHWETLYACDFFAVETLSAFGTVRVMVFFVIELYTRAVHIAGIRINPNAAWLMQVTRNLLDPAEGFLRNATHLVHDRDPLFTKAWTELPKTSCVNSVRFPASSPTCNPYAERFVRAVRAECLDHFVVFGEQHLRHLVREFVTHYNNERYHQGLGGRLVRTRVRAANDILDAGSGPVRRRSRLGGYLNFYHRQAA